MKTSKNILKTKYKLAVLTSHPIQYQAPLFQLLAKQPEIDLTVYFCRDFGVKETYDPEFGKKLEWDIPLLGGYRCKFLKNYSFKPSGKFWGQVNFGIVKKIFFGKYDAILVFGWNSFANWLAFVAAFINGTPVFLRGENPLNQELLKAEWKRKIKKIILGWLFKRIGIFLYLGEENKKFYRYYGVPEKKLIFCPYAVDNERFMKEHQSLSVRQKALRKESGVEKDDIVIIFAGKLIEKKRPMDLLEAYHRLAIRNSKSIIHLLFVGDGALRPKLENYTNEHNLKNVHFTGFKNQTEMPEYYALADVLVLPSGAGETWGLAVNEAMCFGLAIIVSDLVGCGPDLVKSGENGYIFPLGNVNKLAECLENLIENPRKIRLFGKKSFEIIQNYGYKKDLEAILKALNYK